MPHSWKLIDSFPTTVTGKVQKFRMREISIVELGLEDVARIKTAERPSASGHRHSDAVSAGGVRVCPALHGEWHG